MPNRVWGSVGPPCLTYLATYILVVAQADLLFVVCVLVVPQLFTKQPGSVGHGSLLTQLGWLRTRSHVTLTGYPNPSHTVEADSRARPTFELDVDSPGATQSCVLLVRGTNVPEFQALT